MTGSFSVAFQAVAQLFLLGLVGWVAVRRGIIDQKVISALARLMIDLLIPGLMFVALLRGFDPEKLSGMAGMIGLSVAWIFLGFGLGWAGTRLWSRRDAPQEDRALIAMAGIQNSFYLPMPLVAALLPADRRDEGLVYIGAAVIALSFLQWSVAPVLLSRPAEALAAKPRKRDFLRKVLLNPPLLGILAGCVASQIPVVRHAALNEVTGWLLVVRLPIRALDLLVPSVAPLAMILLGSVLATHPIGRHHRWRSSLLVGAIRLLVIPGLVLWVARGVFPGASALFFLVLAVEAGAPPATNLSIIAVRYGDQGGHVSSVLLTTYLASLFTLPMWIGLLGRIQP